MAAAGRRRDTEQLVVDHTHHELVARLSARGELDAVDECGWTCLHHAAALGLTHHVEALLDAGCNVQLETTGASSYPSGLDAVGVARHTQSEGWGDRMYICQALQFAVDAAASDDPAQTWRALQKADLEARKAAQEAKDLAAQQEQMEEAAYVQAEAQAKWSIRAELAARERRARGAEQCADEEAAAHARYRQRAEELERRVAELSRQTEQVTEEKQAAEVALAATAKEATRHREKNVALARTANPLAEQQKSQAKELSKQTHEVERLQQLLKDQRLKAIARREALEAELTEFKAKARERYTLLTAERESNEVPPPPSLFRMEVALTDRALWCLLLTPGAAGAGGGPGVGGRGPRAGDGGT